MLGNVPILVWPHTARGEEADGQQAAKAKPGPVLPDSDKIVLLIRTTLLTVNDAIQTGNFTVLRDKAAPSFREGTTAASLAKSLESLVQQRIDLSAVAIIAPQLTDLPLLEAGGRLQLKGYFPGQPVGIAFDLTFEGVQGNWRPFALRLGLAKVPEVKTSAGTSQQGEVTAKPSKRK